MPDVPSPGDDVARIKGIGNKKKEQLNRAGIYSLDDLLSYYPVKYKDRRSVVKAVNASTDKDSLVAGKLIKTRLRQLSGGRSMIECTLTDDSCYFHAVFFNMPYLRKTLKVGAVYVLFGRMRIRNGSRVWTNPQMSIEGGERDIRGIIPVYRHRAGLSDINLRNWIHTALDAVGPEDEWISPEIVSKRKLCDRKFALTNIHFPASERHYKAAKYRLNYEAMLMYQLAVRMSRLRNESEELDSSVPETDMEEFLRTLPYELTEGQKEALGDIGRDLSSRRSMNRLIQGDVGCGKTVIAEAAVFRCAKAGMQSAMMAPTEILAKQHYERMSKELGELGIRCSLLVSGMNASERRAVLDAAASGDTDVLIGTHALIQKDVSFADLALVITDEQHRFGVDQRKTLIRKGRGVNVCVMSATPIPRSLANTVFGDMDFSIIRSMPHNRKKIISRALDKSSRERAYKAVHEEIDKGNLAYIIAPSIDSEDEELLSVNRLYDEIKQRYPGYRIALLHGRLASDEKARIMEEFANAKIQILVSTIVIEVGIDVPNASIIVIENSERFGLAQLHQLRGRVGRSDKQSYCYVINYSNSESAVRRAKAMAEISDGFEISELDYEMRGPGDIMGSVQSGNINTDILSLSRNTDLLKAAIEDAELIIRGGTDTDMEYAYEKVMRDSSTDNSDII